MAKSKSKVLSKVKKRTKGAWKKSREKEARAKGAQLPDGLVNAVAKLSSYKIDENDDGIPYISLTGIVVDPQELKGARATVSHRFAETDHKSIEDVCDDFSNNLQLLGAETEGTTEDDWEGLLKQLAKEKPLFRFNTRAWKFKTKKGEEISGVSVFIQGLADDDEVDDDDEEEEPEDEEQEEEENEEDDDEENDEEEESESDDDEEEDEEEEKDSDWEPEAEEIYNVKLTPRGNPKAVEIVSVNKRKETAKVKEVKSGKVHAKIAWDKLEDAD